MVVQEVRWDKGEAECAEKCTLFCGKEMKIVSREQDICTYRRVGEQNLLSVALRILWCNIIVLKALVPIENINADLKDSFCEELEQVFDQSPIYQVKIL